MFVWFKPTPLVNMVSFFLLPYWFEQLVESPPDCEDETMVPVLTSKKASELPVNEVACTLQVRRLSLNGESSLQELSRIV